MLLYDQVGRLVLNIGTTERQISLDDVSPGSYILSVHSADAIQNLKVIKNWASTAFSTKALVPSLLDCTFAA
jgi:hypothetical protein